MGSKVIRNVTKILKATSGRLFGRVTSGTGQAEELTPSDVRTLLELATVATSGSYNDLTDTPAGGSGDVVGPASAVDNAAARFDTTTGKLIQSSNWIIADNLTASPNNTVNHACIEATGGTTNVSVSIKPKGSGAFCLSAPDGTSTGGNARGANAVDLQTKRSSASQVASGADSFAATANGTASGTGSVAFGGTASGNYSFIASVVVSAASGAYSSVISCTSSTISGTLAMGLCGDFLTVTGTRALGHGAIPGLGGATVAADASVGLAGGGTVSGADNSVAIGPTANARRNSQFSHASGRFSAMGDCQTVETISRRVTTSAVDTELFLNGSSLRFSVQSGTVVSAIVRVVGVKSDGTEVIKFLRDVTIKNVGGTTTLESAPVTIGTDINVSSAVLDLSADNTNDSLRISVIPPAGTWRWMAVVTVAAEMAYGT